MGVPVLTARGEASVAYVAVARVGLPVAAMPQVTFTGSWGRQRRRSSQWRGRYAQSTLELIHYNRDFA
ncbi:hypothetical protein GCM10007880_64800 [Mesorhizobium amorphae]|nr:hypothetical protein GCM10007880_64800 [Mesorhizobium amorphae]